VAAYAANPMLWGELAGTPALYSLLSRALARVDSWLATQDAAN